MGSRKEKDMKPSDDLRQIESQLLMLDHEILMLKFKAEEANPDVMTECYRYVNVLRDQFRSIESQMQALRKAKGHATKKQYAAVNDALNELNCLINSIGMHVRLQFRDSFSTRYAG
jgi:hypothetical protein